MFSQLFGQYLWKKGLLTSEQLKEALELEKSTHVKIGVLAINSGYLTAEQVEEVHSLQAMQDKRFGEIAIGKGYITEAQLEELLGQQKKGHLLLSQAILDKGYMNLELLEQALNNYKSESGLTQEEIEEDDPTKIVRKIVSVPDSPNKDYYYDYYTLLIKNMIRFLDSQPTLEIASPSRQLKAWYVSQKINGPVELTTALSMDEQTLTRMAARFSGEEIEDCSELAQASVAEFLNLHNGIFMVNMSNAGLELSLEPQEISQNPPPGLENANVMSLELPLGKISIWVK